jgi:hypothetical protein
VQLPLFWLALNCPDEHAVQMRSAVAFPAMVTYSPAPQARQVVHDVAFSPALNVPAAQSSQVLSVVGEPGSATRLPATQVVLATQAVPELPS